MKISKKSSSQPVKASDECLVAELPVGETVVVPTVESVVDSCKYCKATEFITKAIGELGLVADNDQIALDAIANLSVILLDLKG